MANTEFINLSEIYLPIAGGSVDGDLEVGGSLQVNDGTGSGTTYDVAHEITKSKEAWDSVSEVVVETGKSGIWEYRKWSDGTAECWGVQSYTNFQSTSGYGSCYYNTTGNINFPFTFTKVPIVFTHILSGMGLMSSSVCSADTSAVNVYIWNHNSTITSPTLQIYVRGQWK